MTTLSVPHPVPSPAEDAENLRKAFQGWGTDEKSVIGILAHRDAAQRRQIRLAYEERFKEDLIKRLESELSGDFEKAVYRWIFEPLEREAIIANVAVKSSTIDYRVIIETVCINNPGELLAVKNAYQARYKRSLEEDFLVPLVGCYRYYGEEIDAGLAQSEAKILHDAMKEKVFNHEEIIRILSTRNRAQLNATFNRFKDDFGISVTKVSFPLSLPLRASPRWLFPIFASFDLEVSLGFCRRFQELTSKSPNELVSALRIAIRCIISPHKYFEKVLRAALGNSGVDEDALTRVVVTRAEKDLRVIKEVYLQRNNVPLDQAIAKATSKDYKNFLLALVGN
ncbi:hypothetical protein Taro_024441 [Colocasia esculenta]|uniref:Annexin n=1 Tax=Colocasia esculenta TaxID=4460 RepID=A0A843V9D4_COLES|nr:hypothetical protein [Colocasia esculenta]